jgi:hypothetical protein
MARAWTCQGCGATGVQHTPGRLRKWCDNNCRRRHAYVGTCVNCGASTGRRHADSIPNERCVSCAHEQSRIWTRERILADMDDWFELFGTPPTATDWNQSRARAQGWIWRVERYEDTGRDWPQLSAVQDVFGSWNAAIVAAGFEPMLDGHKRIERAA